MSTHGRVRRRGFRLGKLISGMAPGIDSNDNKVSCCGLLKL